MGTTINMQVGKAQRAPSTTSRRGLMMEGALRAFPQGRETYIAASFCQVSMTESGFKDIDSIPSLISQAAKSGWSDGP